MESPESSGESSQFFEGVVWRAVLGIGYVVVGLGLFVSIAIDSIALIAAFLVAILLMIVLSLGIVFKREGLRTPENALITVFVLVAMVLLFGLHELTELSSGIVFGVVIVVGVVVPNLLLKYTDYGRTA